jgi:hypothetical protein
MHDFLGELIKNLVVGRDSTGQLCRLQWIFFRGTYLFAKLDPALRGKQKRYVELCVIAAAIFALIADDNEGIQNIHDEAFGPNRFWLDGEPKWPAEAEALTENWLRWGKSWEHADSPIAWVCGVAKSIHAGHRPRLMEEEPAMSSLDAPTPTGDSYASLIPDLRGDQVAPEINAKVDLLNACKRERLAPETSVLALGRYNGIPLSVAAEVLGLSKQDLAAASREMATAKPALQTRLAPYKKKQKKQVKQI